MGKCSCSNFKPHCVDLKAECLFMYIRSPKVRPLKDKLWVTKLIQSQENSVIFSQRDVIITSVNSKIISGI